MGMDVDTVVTPRPIYHADGRKSPDCYTRPTWLRDELTEALGEFPLFRYWGPTASIESSRWIVEATRRVMPHARPDDGLRPAPRLRPPALRAATSPEARRGGVRAGRRARPAPRRRRTARASGRRAQRVRHHRRRPARRPQPGAAPRGAARGAHAGRDGVPRPVGLPRVRGRRPPGRPRVRPDAGRLRRGARGARGDCRASSEVLDRARPGGARPRPRAQRRARASSPSPDAWFTYYYWLDDARAPDFARGVEIHRKPGYDPAELFFDPADRSAKAGPGSRSSARRSGCATR